MYDADFLAVAEDTFGLDTDEARDLHDTMSEIFGLDELTMDDLIEYGDVASDIVAGEIVEDEDEDEYDEDYYEAGEEIEISFELKYETVPS